MGELIGYLTLNGGEAVNYGYYDTVLTQQDIEQHREQLKQQHPGYDVLFTIRKPKGSKLTP